jgi:hypothetical protein
MFISFIFKHFGYKKERKNERQYIRNDLFEMQGSLYC